LADKLFKVWRLDGEEAWVLIHVEVQNQAEEQFGERMYVYHYRIFDRFRRPVVSLAVLGDEQRSWRPQHFGYSLWGCSMRLEFPVVKLLDYGDRVAELEAERNPFAAVVLAHLKTVETRHRPAADVGERVFRKVLTTACAVPDLDGTVPPVLGQQAADIVQRPSGTDGLFDGS
jgi:hypothetical protein